MNVLKKMIVCAVVAAAAMTEGAVISVDPAKVTTEISPNIYGTGMEDVNHEIYGGLDAQRLFGESFEEPAFGGLFGPEPRGVSSGWFKCEEIDGGEFFWDRKVFHQGAASQQLEPRGGSCAIANMGLRGWGVPVTAGRKMVGYVFVRGKVDSLMVGLQGRDGEKTYASTLLACGDTNSWQKAAFVLVPNATDAKARFFIRAAGEGCIWLDDAYLADESTDAFGRIGCRADIVRGFQTEKVNFLRWGGTMVNVPGYRLANMNGKGERRPYDGFWYAKSSGGFGPYEFVRMAVEMKLPCALSISRDEPVSNAVAFAEWTRQFDVPICVEIGNEECVSWFKENNIDAYRKYAANVKRLVAPMRAANPKLTFASAAWWDGKKMDWMEDVFRATDGVVEYWDIHVSNSSPQEARGNVNLLRHVLSCLRKWNPATTMKLAVFEENAKNHDIARALATAITAMGVRELGRDVLTCCGANALQPNFQNDNWWNQGQIFFTPDKVWLQPYGWAKRMGAENHRELLVESKCDDADVCVSATRDRDGRSIVLHVVNPVGSARRLDVSGLDGYKLVRATELSGRTLRSDNPVCSRNAVEPRDATTAFTEELTFKPYSYTVLLYATIR